MRRSSNQNPTTWPKLAEDGGILTPEFSPTVLNDGAWLALSGFG